jgi:hypothetical protein
MKQKLLLKSIKCLESKHLHIPSKTGILGRYFTEINQLHLAIQINIANIFTAQDSLTDVELKLMIYTCG